MGQSRPLRGCRPVLPVWVGPTPTQRTLPVLTVWLAPTRPTRPLPVRRVPEASSQLLLLLAVRTALPAIMPTLKGAPFVRLAMWAHSQARVRLPAPAVAPAPTLMLLVLQLALPVPWANSQGQGLLVARSALLEPSQPPQAHRSANPVLRAKPRWWERLCALAVPPALSPLLRVVLSAAAVRLANTPAVAPPLAATVPLATSRPLLEHRPALPAIRESTQHRRARLPVVNVQQVLIPFWVRLAARIVP